jgi:cellulose synthase/poly-beta-1,6-N-acetylglucosamine synthase-like glycosyltransferase
VAAATGEIVVFSDANAMYDRDALKWLTLGFSDPEVGYVVGAAVYTDAGGNRAAESEGLYWKLEMKLKVLESSFYSVVGGDGAIYAIRRQLFWTLRDDDINDFVNPLQIVAAGYRGLFDSRARCWEGAGDSFAKEIRRKRRIVNRSWRAYRRYAGDLKLWRNARFLFMLWSHKVIRWLAAPLILTAWLMSSLLLTEGGLYVFIWFAISLSIVLALLSVPLEASGRKLPRSLAIVYYFYAVNLAGMLGILDQLRGVRYSTWDHIRKVDS